MAGAYAALMSLTHTSEWILHSSQRRLRTDEEHIESLLRKAHSFQEFLEDYSHRGHREMAVLERVIADLAYAAEDIIESHVRRARSEGSEAESSTSFSEMIQPLLKDMELTETKMMSIKETIVDFEEHLTFVDSSPAVPSSRLAPVPSDQNTLVGFSEKLSEIMDRLIGDQSSRQVIAIVGMGGIGKTTLAKLVHEHPRIEHFFDIHAWATISHDQSAREIILEILSQIDQGKQEESVLRDYQLGERLYKKLYGTRYLIVIDNVWDIEAWDKIRDFFPDNCNRSRILITTRLLDMGKQLSSAEPFEMELLDYNQSWELLCYKVFGKEDCPSELVKLGNNIARKCRGLPLAVVVISGLLAKSNKTVEFWEYVAKNLNPILNLGDDEHCLKILYLSYKNLPIHLKPCFLYMASVPEDRGSVDYLVAVWIAEGLLKPIRGISLEEVADEYIKDLSDRNLIFVRNLGALGRSKTLGMHDLLRDLCEREAQKENFISLLHAQSKVDPIKLGLLQPRLMFCRGIKLTQSETEALDLSSPPTLTSPIGVCLVGQYRLIPL